MLHTVLRAIEFYHDKPVWEQLVKQAMTEDYSWEKSALAYKKLYKSLME
jgi:starch synthase